MLEYAAVDSGVEGSVIMRTWSESARLEEDRAASGTLEASIVGLVLM